MTSAERSHYVYKWTWTMTTSAALSPELSEAIGDALLDAGGRQYIEVPSKNSTKTCSACGSLTGPAGYAGLKVRRWTCAVCGTELDRDVNAALNTLNAGLGISLESRREAATGIAISARGPMAENDRKQVFV